MFTEPADDLAGPFACRFTLAKPQTGIESARIKLIYKKK